MGIENIEILTTEDDLSRNELRVRVTSRPCDPRICCHNPECPKAGKCGGECAKNF